MYRSGARRLILISKTGKASVLLEFIFQKSLSVREETFECIHSLVDICPFFCLPHSLFLVNIAWIFPSESNLCIHISPCGSGGSPGAPAQPKKSYCAPGVSNCFSNEVTQVIRIISPNP